MGDVKSLDGGGAFLEFDGGGNCSPNGGCETQGRKLHDDDDYPGVSFNCALNECLRRWKFLLAQLDTPGNALDL